MKVDYFCHRVFNKYFIFHFQFYIRTACVVVKKEEIMNRQLRTRFVMAGGKRGMTLKEYNEIEKMGKCEDVRLMPRITLISTDNVR